MELVEKPMIRPKSPDLINPHSYVNIILESLLFRFRESKRYFSMMKFSGKYPSIMVML